MGKKAIVITGPTGVGKSSLALKLAKKYATEIVGADSRQIYKGIPISTAVPSISDREMVKHHFVETLNLDCYYSASMYESDALKVLDDIFKNHDIAVVCGGSMMYVDALCRGIDDIPTVPQTIREELMREHNMFGNEWLLNELAKLDTVYYEQVDRNNIKRVFHAVEICRTAGVPYSKLRSGMAKQRDFDIIKVALTAPRDVIFERINNRVLEMVENGLEHEARQVSHLRALNSLNTVGLKEMFKYIDGEWDFETAVARIQKNTRVYAKKQLTWFARDTEIEWVDARYQEKAFDSLMEIINRKIVG